MKESFVYGKIRPSQAAGCYFVEVLMAGGRRAVKQVVIVR